MHYVNEQNMKEILDGIARKIGTGGGTGSGLEDWQSEHTYSENDICVNEGQIYKAIVGFESSTTFSTTKILEEYTLQTGDVPIAYAKGTDITTNDIVSYNGDYYKALYDFTCGDTFGLYALEQYVPKELTKAQEDSIIQDWVDNLSGGSGGGGGSSSFTVYNNAGAHNALYRGKDLTDYFESGDMSTDIRNADWHDIYPGDYIIKSVTIDGTTYNDVKWIVGDLDYFLHFGDIDMTTHHVLLFSEEVLGTSYMNSSNTTSGGYLGSYMWTTTIPKYVTGIQNAFGNSHVLPHREILTNNISAWEWVDAVVNIFNEVMVVGTALTTANHFSVQSRPVQVSAFRYGGYFNRYGDWYYFRTICDSSQFSSIDDYNNVYPTYASQVHSVKPYFLYY